MRTVFGAQNCPRTRSVPGTTTVAPPTPDAVESGRSKSSPAPNAPSSFRSIQIVTRSDEKKRAIDESDRIIKGPTAPKATFRRVDFGLVAKDEETKDVMRGLPSGVQFRSVQTTHDDEPKTSGRAYLYFWPGGLTERASIVLRKGTSTDDGDALTVMIAPLTGTGTVKSGAVSLPKPEDKDFSEREDQGAF